MGWRLVAMKGLRFSRIPLLCGRERMPSAVEMPRNAELNRGAPEKRIATYQ